jgi:Fe-S cluster assembly ATPase SufC
MGQRKGITDMSILEVRLAMMEWMTKLDMDPAFADRMLNEGFSGGEKKRNEILQMAMLEPELAILDETDSGLDIDALRVVAKGVNEVRSARPTWAPSSSRTTSACSTISNRRRAHPGQRPDRPERRHGARRQLEKEGFAPWLELTP